MSARGSCGAASQATMGSAARPMMSTVGQGQSREVTVLGGAQDACRGGQGGRAAGSDAERGDDHRHGHGPGAPAEHVLPPP
ncbi:hypothetical protein [Sphaerisporangium perillae]|uniref:hypothetical protein n=1 Tax=Sphaerisporangium perillae TaxID=2935860 RepID=UPI00200CB659|nr:hypothetical protein [Sphaerisporangium perillae]